MNVSEAVVRNLCLPLKDIAGSATKALAAQQKSPAKLILDDGTALNYV